MTSSQLLHIRIIDHILKICIIYVITRQSKLCKFYTGTVQCGPDSLMLCNIFVCLSNINCWQQETENELVKCAHQDQVNCAKHIYQTLKMFTPEKNIQPWKKCSPLKHIRPPKIFTSEKYSLLENIHIWKLFTPEKYSPREKYSPPKILTPKKYFPLKNIHSWKIFTPENIHLWKIFTPGKYSPLKNNHPWKISTPENIHLGKVFTPQK